MNKLEEARRRGYLMSANQEEEDAWYAECARKKLAPNRMLRTC